MTDLNKITKAQQQALKFAEENDYYGYDLYDGLKVTDSEPLLKNKVFNAVFTQSFKRNPVNLRQLAGISKSRMPKGMGIFLNAHALMARVTAGDQRTHHIAEGKRILQWLDEQKVEGYSGICWNFGFNYKFMFHKPTVVITSIIARGLHEYYLVTQDEQAKRLLLGTKDFILNDLFRTETEDGLCFSYTPIKPDCCYNASMLATETLARIYSFTGEKELLNLIKQSMDFNVAHQHRDGRWNYAIEIESGKERPQVDFHQGYVVESMHEIMRWAKLDDPKYQQSVADGTKFYFEEQFYSDGRALRRIPRIWPVDIHNQAQGIITFTKLRNLDERYLPFAKTVAEWTIDNMQDLDGHFYYQVHKYYTIKTSYMRWAQAWMVLGMALLLNQEDKAKLNGQVNVKEGERV
ncbi:MAG: hypothetical protein WD077_02585 [Bacteroidia bacterium]